MADEVSTVMVLRMRDEASAHMNNFAVTTEQAQMASLNFQMTLTAVGGALTAVGALVNQVDNDTAKLAATFLMTGGAIMTTVSAIISMLPHIRSLIVALRAWAVTQAIVRALQGPVGWAMLGIGLGVAAAAIGGIYALGGFGGGRGGTVNNYNFNDPTFMENEDSVRKLSERITEKQTEMGRGG